MLHINLLGFFICIANAPTQTAVTAQERGRKKKKKKHDHAILEWVIPAPISGSELRWAQVIRLQNSQVANSSENYQTVGKGEIVPSGSGASIQGLPRLTLFKAMEMGSGYLEDC